MDVTDLRPLSDAIQKADIAQVEALTTQALDDGLDPGRILSEGMVAGMDVVGARFKNGELFVPEVMVVARAMHAGLEILRPKLVESGIEPLGKMVLGTVEGDLHDIGKNMVGLLLQGAGFVVIDIGTNCSPGSFVEAAGEEGIQLVGMSALLTSTMTNMQVTLDALHDAGLNEKVKTMIGGAVVTERFADEIGADGYAPDAASAVDTARELLAL